LLGILVALHYALQPAIFVFMPPNRKGSAMTTAAEQHQLQQQGLYDPANEHDACGVGFVAHIKGQKSHAIVQQGLKILENLDHRGAVGADKLMGDGAGLLIQLPDALYRNGCPRRYPAARR
jgi:Glutamine amidotransferases class-II